MLKIFKCTTLNPLQTESRKDWIDAARALAMLFVMYGHLADNANVYYVFTSPIKIPLFFAISGYLFQNRGGNTKLFFTKLFKGLVIPWLVLSLGPIILLLPLKGLQFVGRNILKVILGKEYWYMPCCIIAEIILFFIIKYAKNRMVRNLVILALSATGLLLSKIPVFDNFKFATALVSLSYMLIGIIFKEREKFYDDLRPMYLLFAAVGYVLLCVASEFWLFPGRYLDVNANVYYNLVYCALLIVLGCWLVFAVLKRFNRFPRSLLGIGRNTLVFYIFHTRVNMFIVIEDSWWSGLVKTLVAAIVCGIMAWCANRILPEAVGKKRKRKSA